MAVSGNADMQVDEQGHRPGENHPVRLHRGELVRDRGEVEERQGALDFAMNGGGRFEGALDHSSQDEVDEFHERREPRVTNLLEAGDDVHSIPAAGSALSQEDVRRLARSLSPGGASGCPDSDGDDEVMMGDHEQNARRYRSAWRVTREQLRVAEEALRNRDL